MVKRAFVLAGGGSTRFGSDKALHLLDGRPMVLHVVEALQGAGLDVALVVRTPSLASLGLPLLQEPESEGFYPLRGILSGLDALEPGESAIFAPCDLPFIDSSSVLSLVETSSPAVASDGTRVHPLFAHYAASARDRLALLLEKQGSARSFAETAERVVMPVEILRNINHPDDLESV